MKKQNRRTFIIQASKMTALFAGFVTFGKHLSFSQPMIKVSTPSMSTVNSNTKVLVAYDSQFGSTASIAKFIGKNLQLSEAMVDVKKISEVKDLSIYNHIIIGSAIQYDKWMKEAKNFIIKNEVELSTQSVSFFLVCLVLSKKTNKAVLKANLYAKEIESLVPKIEVQNFGKFAGVLDYSKMKFGQRILAKGIFTILGVKEGDYRDWKNIKKWSKKN